VRAKFSRQLSSREKIISMTLDTSCSRKTLTVKINSFLRSIMEFRLIRYYITTNSRCWPRARRWAITHNIPNQPSSPPLRDTSVRFQPVLYKRLVCFFDWPKICMKRDRSTLKYYIYIHRWHASNTLELEKGRGRCK